MGGDCDTVGAIAGQLGGAIYGISQYMLHLYGQMEDVKSGRIDVFLKAYKLMTHNPIWLHMISFTLFKIHNNQY